MREPLASCGRVPKNKKERAHPQRAPRIDKHYNGGLLLGWFLRLVSALRALLLAMPHILAVAALLHGIELGLLFRGEHSADLCRGVLVNLAHLGVTVLG